MESKLYQVIEIGKGIRESYTMISTDKEMSKYLKSKNDMNGYIPGLGGDKNYSAVAWTITKDGFGFVQI